MRCWRRARTSIWRMPFGIYPPARGAGTGDQRGGTLMNVNLSHTWLNRRTIHVTSRTVVVLTVLFAILLAIMTFHTSLSFAGAGGSSCTSALEIPLSNTQTGFVTSSSDDWFKVYISSPGYMSIGIFNNQASSTDLLLNPFEHGCTGSDSIDMFGIPKGYSGWPIQEGDLWVTPGYYYLGFAHNGSESGNCFFSFKVLWDPPDNEAPTLNLTGPSSDITVDPGDTVTIQWSDSDPDDNAIISLARDSNCTEGGHTWLTVSLAEDPDGSGDQYYWDTTGVPEGTYRIWGMIYDGT
ncbi:hypothetical protein ACFLU8_04675, partial [Chloroflexota bacterium]